MADLGAGAEGLNAYVEAAGLSPGPEVAEGCEQEAEVEEEVEGAVGGDEGEGEQKEGGWEDYGEG